MPRRGLLTAGLLATLALLLLHSYFYRFLTDDAFISFRYARNLAAGDGLVFNPGLERVEGYTNFLWVMVLTAFELVGLRPEVIANVLSMAATVVLWILVVRYARSRANDGAAWIVLLAPLWLAATRSIAVWSTGGLETRLYEVLVVAATLRLLAEIETPRVPLSGLLFGLATLTRPDGLLLSLCGMGAATVVLYRRGRLDLRSTAWRFGSFAALVGAHLVFRLAYYGAWLPNTYYAKVGGRSWWDMGLAYVGLFSLEYAVVLWIPFLVAGIAYHRRQGTSHVPLVFGAMLIPYVLYLTSIGGDHFEFRPLDLVFPFAFLLMADGARQWVAWRGRGWTVALATLVLVGLVWLPARSHRQFPDRYHGGFPGNSDDRPLASAYLAPEDDPILWLPGLRWIAEGHRRLLETTTSRFVALRQEEHRLFFEHAARQGLLLRDYVAKGVLPPDLHISLACVGAVPYYSNLRTLDRLGLTDAYVARAGIVAKERFLGHEKRDIDDYARRIGVEFWPFRAVEIVFSADDPTLLAALALFNRLGSAVSWADLGDGNLLVGQLLQGEDTAAERFPRLRFLRSDDPAAFDAMRRRIEPLLEKRLAENPDDWRVKLGLAQARLLGGDPPRSERLFREVVARNPESVDAWKGLSGALASAGNVSGAVDAMERAVALARAGGRVDEADTLEDLLERLRRSG